MSLSCHILLPSRLYNNILYQSSYSFPALLLLVQMHKKDSPVCCQLSYRPQTSHFLLQHFHNNRTLNNCNYNLISIHQIFPFCTPLHDHLPLPLLFPALPLYLAVVHFRDFDRDKYCRFSHIPQLCLLLSIRP